MRTAYDVIIRPIITEQSMEDLSLIHISEPTRH